MKKLKKAVFLIAALAMTVGPLLATSGAKAAGSVAVHYYFVPASATVTSGQSLPVQIWEDSGADQINTVSLKFDYPSSGMSLQRDSSNYPLVSYSAFDGGASQQEDSGGAGTITIARIYPQRCIGGNIQSNGTCDTGTLSKGLSGPQAIATVYFTVTASSGNLNLSFEPSSTAYTPPTTPGDPSTVQQATTTSTPASYTFGSTASPPPPPPSSGGSGSGGSSSSSTKKTSTTTVKPAGNTTYKSTSGALTISDISVSNLSGSSATVNWASSAAATAEVDYGAAADQLYFTDSDGNFSTSHSISLNSANLEANKTFYFRVKSTDQSGNVATSATLSFMTSASAAQGSSSKSMSKTTAIAAVSGIAVIAIIGAIAIRGMHKRSLESRELASHVVSAPGTAIVNGKVTVTPDPKQTPPTNNPNGPQTG